jgi:hypothetical protein
MRRVSPSRCNRLEALAPSFLDAIRNEEIWNHQIRLKNSRKITLRRRRRANLCDIPATSQKYPSQIFNHEPATSSPRLNAPVCRAYSSEFARLKGGV